MLAVMRRVDCQPLLLRLAWSEAATFDSSVRKWPDCGGCVGYIRHDSELDHPNNSGLRKAVLILRDVKKKHSLISWADLIQMAGALAVESTGGPRIDMVYGRVDCPIDAPIASHSSYNTVRKSHDKKSGTGKIVAALLDNSKLSQDPQSLIKQNNKVRATLSPYRRSMHTRLRLPLAHRPPSTAAASPHGCRRRRSPSQMEPRLQTPTSGDSIRMLHFWPLCSRIVCLFACLLVCLSICLSIYLSIYLSVCLPVYLCVCLPLSCLALYQKRLLPHGTHRPRHCSADGRAHHRQGLQGPIRHLPLRNG